MQALQNILDKCHTLIVKDEEKVPKVSSDGFSFNGVGKEAHETFVFSLRKGFYFCKTAYKQYDIVVCAVLSVLGAHYGKKFQLSSDGNEMDWKAGIRLAQKEGYTFPGFTDEDDQVSVETLMKLISAKHRI